MIQYTKEHARDEWLIGGLTGIKEQFDSLIVRQKEIIQKETDLKEAQTIIEVATKKLDAALNQSGIHRQELEVITKNLQQDKNILNEILGEKNNCGNIVMPKMAFFVKRLTSKKSWSLSITEPNLRMASLARFVVPTSILLPKEIFPPTVLLKRNQCIDGIDQ